MQLYLHLLNKIYESYIENFWVITLLKDKFLKMCN